MLMTINKNISSLRALYSKYKTLMIISSQLLFQVCLKESEKFNNSMMATGHSLDGDDDPIFISLEALPAVSVNA
jgi:hypothetical protein